MLTIGVDSHKHSLTAVAVDRLGRKRATLRVPSSSSGQQKLLTWSSEVQDGERVRWGIEGSGSYGRPLAQFLSRKGNEVFEVPGRATARERGAGLGIHREKTDCSDALAIARVTLRESESLPRVRPTTGSFRCKLLSEHRDNLVLQRTRVINQLHAQHTMLDSPPMPSISAVRGRALLERWAAEAPESIDPIEYIQHQIVQQLARLILTYDAMIRDMGRQLVRLAEETAPELVRVRGVGGLTAARILGEIGDINRFSSESKFASYCGVAPIQASSGDRIRHRLNRRGNRQLNFSLHTIAVTQRRWEPRAKEFLERKTSEGKSKKEALRCLKRHLANVVFRILKEANRPAGVMAAA